MSWVPATLFQPCATMSRICGCVVVDIMQPTHEGLKTVSNMFWILIVQQFAA